MEEVDALCGVGCPVVVVQVEAFQQVLYGHAFGRTQVAIHVGKNLMHFLLASDAVAHGPRRVVLGENQFVNFVRDVRLEHFAVVDVQLLGLVGADHEQQRNGIVGSRIDEHILAVSLAHVGWTAAGEGLVERDAVGILHVAQFLCSQCIEATAGVADVETERAAADVQVGQHLAGSQQSVERRACIDQALHEGLGEANGDTESVEVALHDDVVRIQRIGQQHVLQFAVADGGGLVAVELGVVVHHQDSLAANIFLPDVFGNQDGAAQHDGLALRVNTGIDIVHLGDGTLRMEVNGNAVGINLEPQRVGIDSSDRRLFADGQFGKVGLHCRQLLTVVGGDDNGAVFVEIDG